MPWLGRRLGIARGLIFPLPPSQGIYYRYTSLGLVLCFFGCGFACPVTQFSGPKASVK